MDTTSNTAFPIDKRLARRWSPYVFSTQPVPRDALRSVFEAARWAPSSFNEQPWRFIVGLRDDGNTHSKIVECLAQGNQTWAEQAPVLIIGVYQYHFTESGQHNKAAPHDLGLASAQMVIEAGRHELFAHMMIGLDPSRARELFEIPDHAEAYIGMAIGYHDRGDNADPKLREREQKTKGRIPQQAFVFSDHFGQSADF